MFPDLTVPLTGAGDGKSPVLTTSNMRVRFLEGFGTAIGRYDWPLLGDPFRPGRVHLRAVLRPPDDVADIALGFRPRQVRRRIEQLGRGRRIGLLIDRNGLVGLQPGALDFGTETEIDEGVGGLGVAAALRDAIGLAQDGVLVPLRAEGRTPVRRAADAPA